MKVFQVLCIPDEPVLNNVCVCVCVALSWDLSQMNLISGYLSLSVAGGLGLDDLQDPFQPKPV